MAKQTQTKKITVNRKAVSAVTLLVLLALTVVFILLGITGRDMDKEGLYKLLPGLPTTGETYRWRDALVPGAGLGDTMVQTLAPSQSGEAASPEGLDSALRILAMRLRDLGWTDAAVERGADGLLKVTLPSGADTVFLGQILSAKGEFTFSDPEGNVFLTGDHITSAGFAYADQSATSFALSFQFDQEGKEIFGQKSVELLGQSITLKRDGEVLASPSINTPLLEGGVSIPNFTLDVARENAVLMRSGALPFALELQNADDAGLPLLGNNVQRNLIIALLVLLAAVALYLTVRYRLGGLMASWMLLLQLALSWFFAALIGAGFTVLTLAAVYVPFFVSAFAVMNLFGSVSGDILHGRSVRQALKEGYAGRGHASLDVYVALIVLSVVLIIMDTGVIKQFGEIFAISLILGLILTHLALRLALNEGVNLFGSRTALYTSGRAEKKEA